MRHGNIVFPAALAVLVLAFNLAWVKPFSYMLFWSLPTIAALLTGVMIICFLERMSPFNNAAIRYIGTISYSLYLFQQFPLSARQGFTSFSWAQFWIVLIVTLIFVVIWNRFGEMPLTRYGARRFPRLTSGRALDGLPISREGARRGEAAVSTISLQPKAGDVKRLSL